MVSEVLSKCSSILLSPPHAYPHLSQRVPAAAMEASRPGIYVLQALEGQLLDTSPRDLTEAERWVEAAKMAFPQERTEPQAAQAFYRIKVASERRGIGIHCPVRRSRLWRCHLPAGVSAPSSKA